MLGWRHWFRREVILPSFFLILAGVGLVWLAGELMPLLKDPDFNWLMTIFLVCVAVYALFAYVTMRHVLTTYTLERFDPGDPASVRRLADMGRFTYRGPRLPTDRLKLALVQSLERSGFVDEAEHPVVGRVLSRITPPRIPLIFKPRRDRVFIVERTPLNVFIVDFTIRDALSFLEAQTHEPSDHNMMIFLTQEEQLLETASAAAGVVNFLGKTDEGTLGVLMFDGINNRMYFPIDQTLLPLPQRRYLTHLRSRLLTAVRQSGQIQPGAVQ